jgi:large subunit ribosomal protein L23
MSSTTKSAYDIIIRPIVTEKSVNGSANNKFTFLVSNKANKYEIAWALEQIQAKANNKINVVAVNVVNVKGKERRGRFAKKMNRGFSPDWRKAIVTIEAGQTIELVEGV